MRILQWVMMLGVAVSLSAADFEVGRRAYENGDYAAALAEWKPLAEIGAPFAAYNVGLMYAKGKGVPQDFSEAAKWYLKSAEKGVPEAQYNLGVMYSSGTGVPKDYTEASKWFTKAAEKGDVEAENSLATLYDAGEGSFKNYTEAEKWYRRAAEAGNSNAQFNLGVMYDIGQGVKSDYAEAERWYRKAADQWNEGALCNLAILYYNGDGVKRDLIQSHEYYLLAKEAGDPRASNLIELTTEKLNKKQIEKAQALAAEFKTAHEKQILAAKNPSGKAPTKSDTENGPETAGLSAKVATGGSAESTNSLPAAATPVATAPANVPAAPVTAPAESDGRSVWTGIERVVAVGDLHGDYEQFTSILRAADLLDPADNWSGGKTHLVQTGDVVDEGPDSRRILELLMKLEPQAAAAGGRVHCLIGNHEAMDVYGDLRFVSPAGFGEFRTPASDSMRDAYYQKYISEREAYAKKKGSLIVEELPRAEWLMQHPPGFFEHREAFAPDGIYGKWILSHNSVIRIDNVLFSHAGISPKYVSYSLDAINRMVRDELSNHQTLYGGIVTDLQGPLWYSGIAANGTPVDEVLRTYQVQHEVTAHVDGASVILPMHGGKIIMIDVGLSRSRDNLGNQACLIVDHDKLYALYHGTRLALPNDDGADMLRYLKQAAALDPQPSPLAARIQDLESSLAVK